MFSFPRTTLVLYLVKIIQVLYLVKIIQDRSVKCPVLWKGYFERLIYLLSLAEIPWLFHSFTLIKDCNLQLSTKEKWLWETFSVNQVMIFSRYMCSKREIEIYNICKVKQNQLSFGKLIFRYSESTHHITVKMCVVFYVFIWVCVYVHTYKISFLCKFLVKTWKNCFINSYWELLLRGFFFTVCQSYKVFWSERII